LLNRSPYAIGPLSCLCVCPVSLSVCDVGVLWPNGWTDQDETWHASTPRPWPHCVRWGPTSPSPKGAQPPNFRPTSVAAKWLHGSRCHSAWLGLGPGDFVLDGDPAPLPKKGVEPPAKIFGPCLLCQNGWMDQDGTWRGGKPQPRRLCIRWGPSLLPKRGRSLLPNFRPISIVAKRLDASRCHLVWR